MCDILKCTIKIKSFKTVFLDLLHLDSGIYFTFWTFINIYAFVFADRENFPWSLRWILIKLKKMLIISLMVSMSKINSHFFLEKFGYFWIMVVKEYHTMHHFGIPRNIQSMISYRFWLSYLVNSSWKLHCGIVVNKPYY